MGRELRMVPVGFDWPVGKTWWGFVLPGVTCLGCKGGKVGYRNNDYSTPDEDGLFWCSSCDGEGRASIEVDLPKGPAFQMWETTSEGSPISPPFETAEKLARWLADAGASSFGAMTSTYEQWLSMIGKGWAPSMVSVGGDLKSGVDYVSEVREEIAE